MDLGRRGTTPYIFTFRCLILTWFFGFGKKKWLITYNLPVIPEFRYSGISGIPLRYIAK